MALIAPQSSALKALPGPKFSDIQSKKSALKSLKMIPQAELVEVAAPSVLAFVQLIKGGCQITSLITGALGG